MKNNNLNFLSNSYVSIKEFSEMAGVSYHAVYKQKEKRLKKYLTKVNNRYMIDTAALWEVYKLPEFNPFLTKDKDCQKDIEPSSITLEYIQTLKEQLAEKDKQIEMLNQQIFQEKQLRLAELQQAALTNQEEEPKRQRWSFFKKKAITKEKET